MSGWNGVQWTIMHIYILFLSPAIENVYYLATNLPFAAGRKNSLRRIFTIVMLEHREEWPSVTDKKKTEIRNEREREREREREIERGRAKGANKESPYHCI